MYSMPMLNGMKTQTTSIAFQTLLHPLGQQCTSQKSGGIEENCIHEIGKVQLPWTAVEGGVVGVKGNQNGF